MIRRGSQVRVLSDPPGPVFEVLRPSREKREENDRRHVESSWFFDNCIVGDNFNERNFIGMKDKKKCEPKKFGRKGQAVKSAW